jgi:D-Tyr-tRNAtyr deacylase
MRAVVQRVKSSAVNVGGTTVGRIGAGLMVLLGVTRDDEMRDAEYLAAKIVHLRIFEDEAGKMNRSLVDCGGAMLVVSQFTLLGRLSQGPPAVLRQCGAAGQGRGPLHPLRRPGPPPGSARPDRLLRRHDGSDAGQRRTGNAGGRQPLKSNTGLAGGKA